MMVRSVLGRSVVAKLGASAVSASCGLIVVRIVVTKYGVESYALYGLMIGIAAALPFSDLGMSAAVINAVSGSSSPENDPVVRDTLISATRVLILSAVLVACASLLLFLLGWWPTVLGTVGTDSRTENALALGCMLVFAAGIPISSGQRVLIGLGKNHFQIWLQGSINLVTLALVAICVLASLQIGELVAVIAYLASLLVGFVAWAVAVSGLGQPLYRDVRRGVWRFRSTKGAPVMNVGWPMMIQMVALPVALQSDRIILSHRSSVQNLASYSLALQLFGVIMQIAQAVGIALWPVFSKARASGGYVSPFRYSGYFGLCAVAVSVAIATIAEPAAAVIAKGSILLGPGLLASFVIFSIVQAVKVPIGMYLTDGRGLRFQAIPSLLMAGFNVPLCIYLVDRIGAAGPALAGSISVAIFQVVPAVWYVRKDSRARRLNAAKFAGSAVRST
jgi:O-antigen/teichoic acid export membrane protein